MDKTTGVFRCFHLAVLILSVYGTDPLQINFFNTPSSKQVRTGEQFTLNCTVNRGLSIILEYKIQFVQKSMVEPDKLKELTEQQALLPSAHPDFYGIVFSYDSTHTNAVLTVKNVQNNMDGQYICRAKSIKPATAPDPQVAVDVTVFSDVQAVELTVDSNTVRETPEVPVVLEQGRYPVGCTAKGFNSETADVTITLDGQPLETTAADKVYDQAASIAAKARRYSLTVKTVEDVMLRPSNRKIECAAAARDAKAVPKTNSAPLEITFLEPEVECVKNVSAMPGDKYVKLRCTVKTNNVAIDKYSWVIGENQRVISQGEKEMETYDEIIVEPKGEVTDVILDLHQVNEEHFESEIYLEIHVPEREGGPIREAVQLIRLPPSPTNGCARLASTALVIALITTIAIFLHVRA